MKSDMKLNELVPGRVAKVTAISGDSLLETSLREMGFAEADEVEVLSFGPLGRSPISVRLNRMIVALRKDEASCIDVEPTT